MYNLIKINVEQGSLFSKAYGPLAQQYFSAGPLPPPLLHPLLGVERGILFHVHFWGEGGSSSTSTSGGVLFRVHFQGGSSSASTSGGSHVTYPIILLYTAIECPSASWAKFICDPPRVEQTDRQTRVKTLPSHTTWRAVITTGPHWIRKPVLVFDHLYLIRSYYIKVGHCWYMRSFFCSIVMHSFKLQFLSCNNLIMLMEPKIT